MHFYGAKTNLTLEHLSSRCFGGFDDEKNLIWVYKKCNLSKGSNRLYEAWTKRWGLDAAKYSIPKIGEGKHLKLVYEVLRNAGMLDLTTDEIWRKICPVCDLRELCRKT